MLTDFFPYLNNSKFLFPLNQYNLFHYDGNEWKLILKGVQSPSNPDEVKEPFLSVWGYQSDRIFLIGHQLYLGSNGNWEELGSIGFSVDRIRGRNENDIFAVGNWGYIGHYNGINWEIYSQFADPIKVLRSVFIINENIFAVGRGSSALTVFGKLQGSLK